MWITDYRCPSDSLKLFILHVYNEKSFIVIKIVAEICCGYRFNLFFSYLPSLAAVVVHDSQKSARK